jgi:hypothetical protein
MVKIITPGNSAEGAPWASKLLHACNPRKLRISSRSASTHSGRTAQTGRVASVLSAPLW